MDEYKLKSKDENKIFNELAKIKKAMDDEKRASDELKAKK